MSSIDIDDTDLPEYFQAKAMKKTPERAWIGLDDDEMLMIYGQQHEGKKYSLGRMVEAKLREKNEPKEEDV